MWWPPSSLRLCCHAKWVHHHPALSIANKSPRSSRWLSCTGVLLSIDSVMVVKAKFLPNFVPCYGLRSFSVYEANEANSNRGTIIYLSLGSLPAVCYLGAKQRLKERLWLRCKTFSLIAVNSKYVDSSATKSSKDRSDSFTATLRLFIRGRSVAGDR